MKVTFFGSSHGLPEPHRKCSSILLEAGGNKYLIDAGCDPVPLLIDRGMKPEDIKAVFITHPHGDHMDGLVPFVDQCSWYYKEAQPTIFLPEIRMADALREWLRLLGVTLREGISFLPVEEGVIYDDGVIRVTARHTGHVEKAFCYFVEAEGKKVYFSGDMKHMDGPVADYARLVTEQMDLVVVECAHFDANLYYDALIKNPPKAFCLNHYSTFLIETCYQLRRRLDGAIPFIFATDDMTIEV